MFYAITHMSDLKPGDRSVSRIKLGHAALRCLVAAVVTAMWAGILYGISAVFGWELSLVIVIPLLTAIFVMGLLVVGLAVSASDDAVPGEGADRDP
jgi:hypothetical protein